MMVIAWPAIISSKMSTDYTDYTDYLGQIPQFAVVLLDIN
jgi:hypothetical protein